MENYDDTGKYISYIYRMSQSFINKKLEPYHIGSGQYAFLMILFREGGISQEALSDRIKVDKATTGRAIQKLMKEGYVYRERDPQDRRSYKIHLTEKGMFLKSIIINTLREWNNLLLKDMEEEERKVVVKFLNKMAQNISK